VPVTAKLSRKFYEKLGDDVAAELVDWFNAVDATYKSELKETNELNWERFKATLHEEISSLRAELLGEISTLRGELRGEISSLRAQLLGEISSLRGELRGEISSVSGGLRSEMKAIQANMMKWMFIYWSGTVAAIIGMGYFGPR
jgi:ABC-type Na+ efflux pump permease subunit